MSQKKNIDLEIARQAKMKEITEIATSAGIAGKHISKYGDHKAKISFNLIEELKDRKSGKLILVSAITPTPAGEGKTTTSIGLHDGMRKVGFKSQLALREPSLGPVFGMKGGATGGGYAQVVPMEDINLHFTGDICAVERAHNLISAAVDNEIHWGKLRIDSREIRWKRVMDMNDRSLRDIVISLGGQKNGFPRESGFDITAASEIMAILCLAENYENLKEMISKILVGFDLDQNPVYVKDLKVHGAAAALLKDAMKPNLVQTIENNPVFIHGGPFANIAQGANSILATRLALKLADFTITEGGFGFDLGAEKFFDIVARKAGFTVDAVVLVATIRALKYHGLHDKQSHSENLNALRKGFANLEKHYENIGCFGVPAIVAINKFSADSEAEVSLLKEMLEEKSIPYSFSEVWEKGGAGALDLARKTAELASGHSGPLKPLYPLEMSVEDKIFTVASKIYGASKIDLMPKAKRDLELIRKLKLDKLPVCIAKTQKSLSDNPNLLGRPKDFLVTVREIEIASGAGFLIPVTGEIMRMPGLPLEPAYKDIDIDAEGNISGLF